MNLTQTNIIENVRAELRDDRDTLDLGDGRMLRLRIEVDQDTEVDSDDAEGRIEWTRRNVWNGHSIRPLDFTGRARIIMNESGNTLWWEPAQDLTDEQITQRIPHLIDLVTYGYKGLIVELCEGTDYYGKPIVIDMDSLWGVDLNGSYQDNADYVAEVVGDLASEVLGRAEKKAEAAHTTRQHSDNV